ncbi:MAG: PH domain-containing protein [Chloroflexi bacterium]|nr:PH domain-containing protein [Chloroflexota bacterium]
MVAASTKTSYWRDNMTSSRDEVLLQAEFDRRVMGYGRLAVSLLLFITLAGIPLIPFWLIWSVSYLPRAYDRFSARLTPTSLELTRGVYFRSDSTIPLDRITDVRLHDDPLMRFSGIQGLKVETAGQSGTTGSEGKLIGVDDAAAFRDAVLRQREILQEGGAPATNQPAAASENELLVEIRDLLQSIDSKT